MIRTVARVVVLTAVASSAVMGQGRKRVDLEHADSLIGTVIDGEEARELVGNVRFTQEEVRVWCDRATQFMRSGKVLLNGNVVVRDDSVTLKAPRGVYHQESRKAEGFDGVLLDDGEMLLTAREGEYFVDDKRAFFRTDVVVTQQNSIVRSDSLTYYRLEKRSVAEGKVRVLDNAQNMTIAGNRLEHWTDDRFSRMTGRPSLVQYDTLDGGIIDTLIVRSRVMESHRTEDRRLLAIDSVRIYRKDLAAIAGLATFYPDGDSMLLRILPVIWYEQTQVTGDSIDLFMKEEQLDRVDVLGHSFAASRIDSAGAVRYDQLSGELMVMRFSDRKLRQVELQQRATSLYHLYEDSLANGLNKTSGDRILIRFDVGKVSSITVVGGVEGQYVPENLVAGKEELFHLPGFVWREDRPVLGAGQ